jgi:hypothetical protein
MAVLETRLGLLHQPRSSADGSADAGRHIGTDSYSTIDRGATPNTKAHARMSADEQKSLDSRSLRSAGGRRLDAPLFRAFSDGVFRSLDCVCESRKFDADVP